jgi:hypothetical protein
MKKDLGSKIHLIKTISYKKIKNWKIWPIKKCRLFVDFSKLHLIKTIGYKFCNENNRL